MKNVKTKLTLTGLAFSTLVFVGCAHSPNYQVVEHGWQTANLNESVVELTTKADVEMVSKNKNAILWELDAGLMAGLAGDTATSSEFLDRAEQRAKTSYKKEQESLDAGVAISRWWSDNYEATQQEVNMIPVYQFFNAFADKNRETVRAAANNIVERQSEAERIFQKRLNVQEAELAKQPTFSELDEFLSKMNEANSSVAEGDEKLTFDANAGYDKKTEILMLEAQMQEVYGSDYKVQFKYGNNVSFVNSETAVLLNSCLQKTHPGESMNFAGGAALASVTNPFAKWLASTVEYALAQDANDLQNVQMLRRNAVEVSQGKSEFLNKEFAAVCTNDLVPLTDTTYVIYEGGRTPNVIAAPIKVQVPEPIRFVSKALIFIGGFPPVDQLCPEYGTAYFPKVQSRGNAPELKVNGQKTEVVVDFDKIVNDSFRAEAISLADSAVYKISGIVLARSAAVAVANVTMWIAAYNKSPIIANIAQSARIAALATLPQPIELDKPDVRHWDYLPRTLEVAKLPTPKDGVLNISGQKVSVPKTGVNFVRVRKDSKNWPAVIQVLPMPQN